MELDLVAFLFLAFIALLSLIILIVPLYRQNEIKRSVDYLFFIAGGLGGWWHVSLLNTDSILFQGYIYSGV